LAIFTSATGRTTWPSTRPWLTVCIAGIRSGKGDRIAKPLALYEALYGGHAAHAAPGETVCVYRTRFPGHCTGRSGGYQHSDPPRPCRFWSLHGPRSQRADWASPLLFIPTSLVNRHPTTSS
jgi:hypothetical protein